LDRLGDKLAINPRDAELNRHPSLEVRATNSLSFEGIMPQPRTTPFSNTPQPKPDLTRFPSRLRWRRGYPSVGVLERGKQRSVIAILLVRWGVLGLLVAALLAVSTACGPSNPVLGEWEMDPRQTSLGPAAFTRQAGFDRITFESDRVLTGDVELSVRYVIEEDRVRVVRTDRDHEDVVELLDDGLINVEVVPGMPVVYRRAGPRAG